MPAKHAKHAKRWLTWVKLGLAGTLALPVGGLGAPSWSTNIVGALSRYGPLAGTNVWTGSNEVRELAVASALYIRPTNDVAWKVTRTDGNTDLEVLAGLGLGDFYFSTNGTFTAGALAGNITVNSNLTVPGALTVGSGVAFTNLPAGGVPGETNTVAGWLTMTNGGATIYVPYYQ